jgi:ABC-type polysaccharide/polyol phosphate transport system ATPase subunit
VSKEVLVGVMLRTKTTQKNADKLFYLYNIDFSVKKGELVGVIGNIGSGKSSLLSKIIGDMIYL